MSFVRDFLRRAFASLLLVAVVGGPAGLAGTLHEADDLACAPGSGDLQERIGVAQAEASHCPTCHLVRSLRFGIAEDVALQATVLHASAAADERVVFVVDAFLPRTPGRSPPTATV